MSFRGYIKLYRAIFTHEFFREEPFSEREAFIWMICEAAWKQRSRRVGQFYAQLERGELLARSGTLPINGGGQSGRSARSSRGLKKSK